MNPRIHDVGFLLGKETRGRYFSEHFGFPLMIDIPTILHTHVMSETGTIIQFEGAAVIQLVR